MARPNPEIFSPGGYRYVTDTGGNTVSDFAAVTRPLYRRDWTGSLTPGFKSLSPRQRAKLSTLNHTSETWSTRAVECTQTEIFRHTLGAGAGKTFTRVTRWDRERSRDLLSVAGIGSEDEASSRAIARLADEIRGAKVNLAQSFAERRQLANMATTNIFRVAAAGLAMKRGDRKAFEQALHIGASRSGWARLERDPATKRLANHWLEYKFGWAPLLQDIHDAADLVRKHIVEDDVHQTAIGSATARKSEVWTTKSGNQRTSFEGLYTTRVAYGVHFRADNASLQILASTGISNPALLAWELFPYSFIVDWALPIGNYLEALDAFSGMTFVDGYKVTYRTGSSTCTRFGRTAETWSNPYYYSVDFAGWVSSMRRSLVRTRLTTYPSVPLPDFKNPIGASALGRFVTALSLLRVAFK